MSTSELLGEFYKCSFLAPDFLGDSDMVLWDNRHFLSLLPPVMVLSILLGEGTVFPKTLIKTWMLWEKQNIYHWSFMSHSSM